MWATFVYILGHAAFYLTGRQLMRKFICLLVITVILQGCASKSHFSSPQDDVKITIGKTNINGNVPLTGNVGRTTFGTYPTKAVKEGYDPIYFNLPLKVSPGIILLDALFFAPAAFFNVQGSVPYYQIDFETGTVQYKTSKEASWQTYNPTEQQKLKAKSFFGD